MLFGSASSKRKPSLEAIRRIKHCLREALSLSEDAVITVTQLACLEEDCAPLETVIGLLEPGVPQRQHKLHKATEDVNAADLLTVCEAWGLIVERTVIESLHKES